MIIRVSHKVLEQKVKFFLQHKIPFIKSSTNQRTVIRTEGWGEWQNKESNFPAKELHFIKSVKDFVIKNKTFAKVRNYFKKEGSNKKIKYFYYNKKVLPGEVFNEAYEVDIKNAYWDTSYFHYNLFSEEIYQKGLTVSKKSRLAAIGSLAKTVTVIQFDGKEEKELDPIKSTDTEFLWNTICHRISKTMIKGSKLAKDDFLFFWVDALFVKDKQSAKNIQAFFKKHGYQSTIAKCEWIKFNAGGLTVKCTEKGKWINKVREETVIRNGQKFIKTIRTKEWKDERPFPYGNAISDKDISNINSID